MKLFFAFLVVFCGLSCALASPACSDEEANKCYTKGEMTDEGLFPDQAITLDKQCPGVKDSLDCQIAFAKRCPRTLLAAFAEGLREYRELFEELCDKGSDFRAKYLKNSRCANRVIDYWIKECTESEAKVEGYCKQNEAILKCARNGVFNGCGEEGAEIFDARLKPKRALLKVFCI